MLGVLTLSLSLFCYLRICHRHGMHTHTHLSKRTAGERIDACLDDESGFTPAVKKMNEDGSLDVIRGCGLGDCV